MGKWIVFVDEIRNQGKHRVTHSLSTPRVEEMKLPDNQTRKFERKLEQNLRNPKTLHTTHKLTQRGIRKFHKMFYPHLVELWIKRRLAQLNYCFLSPNLCAQAQKKSG